MHSRFHEPESTKVVSYAKLKCEDSTSPIRPLKQSIVDSHWDQSNPQWCRKKPLCVSTVGGPWWWQLGLIINQPRHFGHRKLKQWRTIYGDSSTQMDTCRQSLKAYDGPTQIIYDVKTASINVRNLLIFPELLNLNDSSLMANAVRVQMSNSSDSRSKTNR